MQLEHSILKGHCPHLAIIDVAARLAGCSVQSSDVALLGAPRRYTETFSLQRAAGILGDLGIVSVAVRTDLGGLAQLRFPALAQVRSGTRQEFVVVSRIDDHAIVYYSGRLGWLLDGLSSFSKRWTGVALTLEAAVRGPCRVGRDAALLSDLEIQLIQDFMTVDECEELMASASPAFRKSMVSADGSLQSEVMSSGRTSESAACSGDLCARITDRAAELLGCASTLFEPIQCVRYEMGQKFAPHYDVPLDAGLPDQSTRAWTLLAYLNDGFEGGETLFPAFDLSVRPLRGALLMFRNRGRQQRSVNPGALHAGQPVTRGSKYACNIWCSDAN
ncbi:hypothetical protein G6F65_011301 [Rhizopus arrhizus]|nr:hypothetical protein G6F65_011301 [Rhizopus arrhizus]